MQSVMILEVRSQRKMSRRITLPSPPKLGLIWVVQQEMIVKFIVLVMVIQMKMTVHHQPSNHRSSKISTFTCQDIPINSHNMNTVCPQACTPPLRVSTTFVFRTWLLRAARSQGGEVAGPALCLYGPRPKSSGCIPSPSKRI